MQLNFFGRVKSKQSYNAQCLSFSLCMYVACFDCERPKDELNRHMRARAYIQKHLTNIFTILCDSLLVNVMLVYLSKTNANICTYRQYTYDSNLYILYRHPKCLV